MTRLWRCLFLLIVLCFALRVDASPLSQRGLFPSESFPVAWQSYLPPDLLLSAVDMEIFEGYVMQPGFQVMPSVRATVTKLETGFRYSYVVTNGAGSLRSLRLFAVEQSTDSHIHVRTPLAKTMGARNPYGNAIGWYLQSKEGPVTRLVALSLDSRQVQIPVSEPGLFPGESVSGLALESTYLPGVVSAFSRGNGWLLRVSSGAFVSAPINDYMSGKTVGPVVGSLAMDELAFSRYMRTLVAESVSLGWLVGDVAVKAVSFSDALASAKTTAERYSLYRSFQTYLTGFWFGTADMTSEGRALLLFNIEYALNRFAADV